MTMRGLEELLTPLPPIRTARAFVHLRLELRERLATRANSLASIVGALEFAGSLTARTRPLQGEIHWHEGRELWTQSPVERALEDAQLVAVDEIWCALTGLQRTTLELLYSAEERTYDEAAAELGARGVRTARGGVPTSRWVHRMVSEATEVIAARTVALRADG